MRTRFQGTEPRDTKVVVGERYRVEPMNPQAMKNRGRICLVKSIEEGMMPTFAMVSFDGLKRVSKIDLSDLVPAK